jgi:hypothetical protein
MGTILKKINRPGVTDVGTTFQAPNDKDRKIGLLWARHFPMRKRLKLSQTVCATLYLIVRSRALLNACHKSSPDPQSHCLTQCGVAFHEYEQFKSELGSGFEPITGEIRPKLRLSEKHKFQPLRLGGGGGFSGGS